MTTAKNYRKHTIAQPQFEVSYIDVNNQQHKFLSTKAMLQSHQMLMKGNSLIKSFSVRPLNETKF